MPTKTKTTTKKTTSNKKTDKQSNDIPCVRTHWFSALCWGIWKVFTDIAKAIYRLIELLLTFVLDCLKIFFSAWFQISTGLGILLVGIGALFFFLSHSFGIKDSPTYQKYRDENLENLYQYEKMHRENWPNPKVMDGEIVDILDQTCTTHSECKTPAKYLIQSNCPYTSQCMQGRCAVVCPDF